MSRSTPEYQQWREEVFKRFNYKCCLCGATSEEKKLHAHHIIPWDEQDGKYNFDITKGMCLCSTCHSRIHLIGREFSEETRKKISENRKGIQSWNKDKNLSEEHKQKIKKSIKENYENNPETKEKLRQAGFKRKHSEETKKKMSESQKKRWNNYKEESNV